MKTCIYLRKSRQDEELEKHNKFDTLARHRKELLEVAKKLKLDIVDIKQELVSGDSISDRPKMIELLEEVKKGMYDAVLVIHIDRLGRGNLQDQGDILDAFKYSRTKIVTPNKIYDLNDEFDEEYTEFETFMARKELKLIKKRLLRGRIRSVKDGKYMGTVPPWGYKFHYDENTGYRSLVIDEQIAPLIQEIYRLYIEEDMGVGRIATYLNNKGLRTKTGKLFKERTIMNILENKTYAGYNRWNQIERTKAGSRKRPENEIIEVKGNHKPLVTLEDWEKVQEIRSKRYRTPKKEGTDFKNQFAGIVRCAYCGSVMAASTSYQSNGKKITYLRCKACRSNGGIEINQFEDELMNALENILISFKDTITSNSDIKDENNKLDNYKKILTLLENEQEKINRQRDNLHDLLEQGVYDIDTYLERISIVNSKIEENKKSILEMKNKIDNEKSLDLSYRDLIPTIEANIDLIKNTNPKDVYLKNCIYKTIIDTILFKREKTEKKFVTGGEYELDIKLKL